MSLDQILMIPGIAAGASPAPGGAEPDLYAFLHWHQHTVPIFAEPDGTIDANDRKQLLSMYRI